MDYGGRGLGAKHVQVLDKTPVTIRFLICRHQNRELMTKMYRVGYHGGNVLDPYSGSTRFETQSRHWLL
jgi:hypothetical protein